MLPAVLRVVHRIEGDFDRGVRLLQVLWAHGTNSSPRHDGDNRQLRVLRMHEVGRRASRSVVVVVARQKRLRELRRLGCPHVEGGRGRLDIKRKHRREGFLRLRWVADGEDSLAGQRHRDRGFPRVLKPSESQLDCFRREEHNRRLLLHGLLETPECRFVPERRGPVVQRLQELLAAPETRLPFKRPNDHRRLLLRRVRASIV